MVAVKIGVNGQSVCLTIENLIEKGVVTVFEV